MTPPLNVGLCIVLSTSWTDGHSRLLKVQGLSSALAMVLCIGGAIEYVTPTLIRWRCPAFDDGDVDSNMINPSFTALCWDIDV